MRTVRRLGVAAFDMRVPTASRAARVPGHPRRSGEVGVFEAPEDNRYQHGFWRVFAAGIQRATPAQWAEIYRADAWAPSRKKARCSPQNGRRLRRQVLERGGSRDAMDDFRAFRGMNQCFDALMHAQGMTLAEQHERINEPSSAPASSLRLPPGPARRRRMATRSWRGARSPSPTACQYQRRARGDLPRQRGAPSVALPFELQQVGRQGAGHDLRLRLRLPAGPRAAGAPRHPLPTAHGRRARRQGAQGRRLVPKPAS